MNYEKKTGFQNKVADKMSDCRRRTLFCFVWHGNFFFFSSKFQGI